MSIDVPGTEGYAKHAEVLANDWRRISFEDHHRPVLHLIPDTPSRILDVGAGMGRDAAALASMGHAVLAVEPVGPFPEGRRMFRRLRGGHDPACRSPSSPTSAQRSQRLSPASK